MNFYRVGGYAEIGLSFDIVNKYKTERGLINYMEKVIRQFTKDLKGFADCDIVAETHFNCGREINESVRINDFNYGCNNQCEESKEYQVYRWFGVEFIVMTTSNNELHYKDIMKRFTYNYKGHRIDLDFGILENLRFENRKIY